ncbi:DUF2946 family protein [Caldimonas manganoxidans]|uniref:DUF2946 family protein n=1 Tax=Caldimonas manganoxidans TaxID=196015 RepID=UPI0003730C53|nr:DUF2946 family protein [Caldimonas manganoxidans]
MDDIVRAALKKWPNVPACRGWLALDARGQWYMRDERTQAAGPFPRVKGSLITHDKLREFIHRNYEADERGQWYFQNGPQRVYVELECTPWVWRVRSHGPERPPSITSHTGLAATHVRDCLLDEAGRLYLATELGVGLVHSQDMHDASQAIEDGWWQPREVRSAELPERYGYVLSPQAAAAQA